MSNTATAGAVAPNVTETTVNGIRKVRTVGPITVDHVRSSEFDKEGTQQAQIRQEIETISYYPAATIKNSMSDNLFEMSDFSDMKERSFPNTEKRVTWMTVPYGTTPEEVAERLARYPKAVIYRTISNHPILTDNQQMAIRQKLRTKDEFADRQVLRYAPGTEVNGRDVSEELILFRDKVQYRVNHFSLEGKEDVDERTEDIMDQYLTPKIAEELGVGAEMTKGQSL